MEQKKTEEIMEISQKDIIDYMKNNGNKIKPIKLLDFFVFMRQAEESYKKKLLDPEIDIRKQFDKLRLSESQEENVREILSDIEKYKASKCMKK